MMETRDGWTFNSACRLDVTPGKAGCEHCAQPVPGTLAYFRWRLAGAIGSLGLYLAWKLTPRFPPWVFSATGPKCPPRVTYVLYWSPRAMALKYLRSAASGLAASGLGVLLYLMLYPGYAPQVAELPVPVRGLLITACIMGSFWVISLCVIRLLELVLGRKLE